MHSLQRTVQEKAYFHIKYLQVSFYFCSFALDFLVRKRI